MPALSVLTEPRMLCTLYSSVAIGYTATSELTVVSGTIVKTELSETKAYVEGLLKVAASCLLHL